MKLNLLYVVHVLDDLKVTKYELASLLKVTKRTVDRWILNPEEISGPARAVLKAWCTLKRHNLPWRPDCIDVIGDTKSFGIEIAHMRNKMIGLNKIIKDVSERGGSIYPWHIDKKKGIARLEAFEVHFYNIDNTWFSPYAYKNKSILQNNKLLNLIEDGLYSIAKTYRK